MAGRLIDFDAARAERESEPLLLRAFGKTFELPGAMSAALLLEVVRLEEEEDSAAEVTPTQAVGVLRRVIPEHVLEELLANDDFTSDDFVELSRMVMRAYAGYTGADESGEAGAPNRAARRSKPPTKPAPRRGSPATSKPPRAPAARPGSPSSSTGS